MWRIVSSSSEVLLETTGGGGLNVNCSELVVTPTVKFLVDGPADFQTTLSVTGNMNVDSGTLFVDSSSNLVGIGKTNPSTGRQLDVVGNIVTGGSLSATTNLTGSVTTASQPNITAVGTLPSLTVTGNLTVDTTTLVVNTVSGRVGIATGSPGYLLDVTGNFLVNNVTGSYPVWVANFPISKNGSRLSKWTTNTTGTLSSTTYNVGIGTTNPQFALDNTGSGRVTGKVILQDGFITQVVLPGSTTLDTSTSVNIVNANGTTYELISITNDSFNEGRELTLLNISSTPGATVNVNIRQTVGGSILQTVVVSKSRRFTFLSGTWYPM